MNENSKENVVDTVQRRNYVVEERGDDIIRTDFSRLEDRLCGSLSASQKFSELPDDVQFANCPAPDVTYGSSGCSFGLSYNDHNYAVEFSGNGSPPIFTSEESNWTSPGGLREREVSLDEFQSPPPIPVRVRTQSTGSCTGGLAAPNTPSQSVVGNVIRCVCSYTHDDGKMLQCSKCSVWQHFDCVSADNIIYDKNMYHECEECCPRSAIDYRKALQIQRNKRASNQTTSIHNSSLGQLVKQLNDTNKTPTIIVSASQVTSGSVIPRQLIVTAVPSSLAPEKNTTTTLTSCTITNNATAGRVSKRKQTLAMRNTGSSPPDQPCSTPISGDGDDSISSTLSRGQLNDLLSSSLLSHPQGTNSRPSELSSPTRPHIWHNLVSPPTIIGHPTSRCVSPGHPGAYAQSRPSVYPTRPSHPSLSQSRIPNCRNSSIYRSSDLSDRTINSTLSVSSSQRNQHPNYDRRNSFTFDSSDIDEESELSDISPTRISHGNYKFSSIHKSFERSYENGSTALNRRNRRYYDDFTTSSDEDDYQNSSNAVTESKLSLATAVQIYRRTMTTWMQKEYQEADQMVYSDEVEKMLYRFNENGCVENQADARIRERLKLKHCRLVSLASRILQKQGNDSGSVKSTWTPVQSWRVLESTHSLRKYDTVIEFKGRMLLKSEYERDIDQFKHYNPFVLFYEGFGGPDLSLNAANYGNDARFIRRSCSPNCDIGHLTEGGRLHLIVRALCDIPIGTELTIAFDYDYKTAPYVECGCSLPAEQCVVRQHALTVYGSSVSRVSESRRNTIRRNQLTSRMSSRTSDTNDSFCRRLETGNFSKTSRNRELSYSRDWYSNDNDDCQTDGSMSESLSTYSETSDIEPSNIQPNLPSRLLASPREKESRTDETRDSPKSNEHQSFSISLKKIQRRSCENQSVAKRRKQERSKMLEKERSSNSYSSCSMSSGEDSSYEGNQRRLSSLQLPSQKNRSLMSRTSRDRATGRTTSRLKQPVPKNSGSPNRQLKNRRFTDPMTPKTPKALKPYTPKKESKPKVKLPAFSAKRRSSGDANSVQFKESKPNGTVEIRRTMSACERRSSNEVANEKATSNKKVKATGELPEPSPKKMSRDDRWLAAILKRIDEQEVGSRKRRQSKTSVSSSKGDDGDNVEEMENSHDSSSNRENKQRRDSCNVDLRSEPEIDDCSTDPMEDEMDENIHDDSSLTKNSPLQEQEKETEVLKTSSENMNEINALHKVEDFGDSKYEQEISLQDTSVEKTIESDSLVGNVEDSKFEEKVDIKDEQADFTAKDEPCEERSLSFEDKELQEAKDDVVEQVVDENSVNQTTDDAEHKATRSAEIQEALTAEDDKDVIDDRNTEEFTKGVGSVIDVEDKESGNITKTTETVGENIPPATEIGGKEDASKNIAINFCTDICEKMQEEETLNEQIKAEIEEVITRVNVYDKINDDDSQTLLSTSIDNADPNDGDSVAVTINVLETNKDRSESEPTTAEIKEVSIGRSESEASRSESEQIENADTVKLEGISEIIEVKESAIESHPENVEAVSIAAEVSDEVASPSKCSALNVDQNTPEAIHVPSESPSSPVVTKSPNQKKKRRASSKSQELNSLIEDQESFKESFSISDVGFEMNEEKPARWLRNALASIRSQEKMNKRRQRVTNKVRRKQKPSSPNNKEEQNVLESVIEQTETVTVSQNESTDEPVVALSSEPANLVIKEVDAETGESNTTPLTSTLETHSPPKVETNEENIDTIDRPKSINASKRRRSNRRASPEAKFIEKLSPSKPIESEIEEPVTGEISDPIHPKTAGTVEETEDSSVSSDESAEEEEVRTPQQRIVSPVVNSSSRCLTRRLRSSVSGATTGYETPVSATRGRSRGRPRRSSGGRMSVDFTPQSVHNIDDTASNVNTLPDKVTPEHCDRIVYSSQKNPLERFARHKSQILLKPQLDLPVNKSLVTQASHVSTEPETPTSAPTGGEYSAPLKKRWRQYTCSDGSSTPILESHEHHLPPMKKRRLNFDDEREDEDSAQQIISTESVDENDTNRTETDVATSEDITIVQCDQTEEVFVPSTAIPMNVDTPNLFDENQISTPISMPRKKMFLRHYEQEQQRISQGSVDQGGDFDLKTTLEIKASQNDQEENSDIIEKTKSHITETSIDVHITKEKLDLEKKSSEPKRPDKQLLDALLTLYKVSENQSIDEVEVQDAMKMIPFSSEKEDDEAIGPRTPSEPPEEVLDEPTECIDDWSEELQRVSDNEGDDELPVEELMEGSDQVIEEDEVMKEAQLLKRIHERDRQIMDMQELKSLERRKAKLEAQLRYMITDKSNLESPMNKRNEQTVISTSSAVQNDIVRFTNHLKDHLERLRSQLNQPSTSAASVPGCSNSRETKPSTSNELRSPGFEKARSRSRSPVCPSSPAHSHTKNVEREMSDDDSTASSSNISSTDQSRRHKHRHHSSQKKKRHHRSGHRHRRRSKHRKKHKRYRRGSSASSEEAMPSKPVVNKEVDVEDYQEWHEIDHEEEEDEDKPSAFWNVEDVHMRHHFREDASLFHYDDHLPDDMNPEMYYERVGDEIPLPPMRRFPYPQFHHKPPLDFPRGWHHRGSGNRPVRRRRPFFRHPLSQATAAPMPGQWETLPPASVQHSQSVSSLALQSQSNPHQIQPQPPPPPPPPPPRQLSIQVPPQYPGRVRAGPRCVRGVVRYRGQSGLHRGTVSPSAANIRQYYGSNVNSRRNWHHSMY